MIDPREELKAYLDGELDVEASNLVRERLAVDPDLAREAEQYQAISASLAHEWQYEPVGLDNTIAALRRRRPRRFWFLDPRLTVPLAIGSLCVGIGWYVFAGQSRAYSSLGRPAAYSLGASPSVSLAQDNTKAMAKQKASAAGEIPYFGSGRTGVGAIAASRGTVILVRDKAEALGRLNELRTRSGYTLTEIPPVADNEIQYRLAKTGNPTDRSSGLAPGTQGAKEAVGLNSDVVILRWPKSAPAAAMVASPPR